VICLGYFSRKIAPSSAIVTAASALKAAATSATLRGRGGKCRALSRLKAARRPVVGPDWPLAGSLRGDAGRADRTPLKSPVQGRKTPANMAQTDVWYGVG
jgi:hypothetical protein